MAMDIANFFLGRQSEDQKKIKQLRGAGPSPRLFARESRHEPRELPRGHHFR